MKLPLLLIVLSAAFSFGVAEIAYRIKLCCFQSDPEPSYIVTSDAAYRFNRKYGYDYIPNMRADLAIISKGYPVECGQGTVNELGNFGVIRGSYKDSQLRILVIGDSFTATAHAGLTWPGLLQDELQAVLRKSVNVLGFGRDAIGVLQEFDMAATLIEEYKPDLAIIAFITDDLTRARFWRMVKTINGEKRLLTSTTPSEGPDLTHVVDAHLINPRATIEWCKSMLESRTPKDPVLQELNAQYRRLEKDYTPAANYFSPSTSFLYNRLVHKDPVRAFSSRFKRPKLRIDYDSFEQDATIKQKIEILRRSGVPYVMIHLPIHTELKADKYILNDQEQSLLSSLRKISGKEEIGLLGYETGNENNIDKLFMLPHDNHPSAEGNRFYARAVSSILLQHGHLKNESHQDAALTPRRDSVAEIRR